MKKILVLLLLAVTVPAVAPAAPTATSATNCWAEVAVVGRACKVQGGYRIRTADGSVVFTHGADPAPPMDVLGLELPLATSPVACVGDEAVVPHGLAIYFQPSDLPDRLATMTPDIQAQIETANAVLRAEAAEFGVAMDLRMACTAGRPKVVRVVATTTRAAITFESILNDMRLQGYTDTNQKYWIWVDGPTGLGGAGGIGTIESSSADAANNPNNFGPSYATTFGYTNAQGGWFVQLHEAGHNLGAVQNNSFMSSGAFHCNDGLDIMCYPDGGPKSAYTSSICAVRHFDCRHDDYFNPRPVAGTYLARSWNLGSPLNRWVSGCAYLAGRLLPLGSVNVSVDGCSGRPFAASAFVPAHDDPDISALTPDKALLLDVNVCFSNSGGSLGCFNTLNQPERGTVPAGATLATVSVGAAPIADYTFSVI